MKTIQVSDFTIKHLTEQKGASLLFRDKIALAKNLSNVGVNIVEFPCVHDTSEDGIIIKTIASSLKNTSLCVSTDGSVESIDKAWACLQAVESPIIDIALPVSAVMMEYSFHMKEDKMKALAMTSVTHALSLCKNVNFTAVDFTRADIDYLLRVIEEVTRCGVTSVTLADEDGQLLPDEYCEIVRRVREICPCTLFIKTSNLLHFGVVHTAMALKAGADGIKCVMDASEHLTLPDFASLMRSKGECLGVSTTVKLSEVSLHAKSTKDNLRSAMQKVDEVSTGGVCLDADSSVTQVGEAVEQLGYILSDEDLENVYHAMKTVCAKKNSIGSVELEAIIASSAMQVPSTYHLESYTGCSGNKTTAMTHIVLRKNEEILSGVATGDGPIDAAFKAIESCVGFRYELDDFQIQAVTDGKDALGSALVKLRNKTGIYAGNGISTDIVGASIRAYLNALNKIIYEEERA